MAVSHPSRYPIPTRWLCSRRGRGVTAVAKKGVIG
eukprot:COSAG01_NODE_56253_length_319_cov_1.636364_1_plen_34_part_01